MGLSRIFDISSRSLQAYQQALDVTAHNVANSSNPDFSRRRVVLTPNTPQFTAGLVWGTGVQLTDIQRLRDTFADNQIRSNNQKNADADKQAQLLGQIEQTFSEPSDLGLSNYITNFFNSWGQAATNPTSIPLRNNLLNSASQLSSKIKNIHDDLVSIQASSAKDFTAITSTLNTDLQNIQGLNQQIYEAKMMGSSSADLEDQRDKLLDDVSKMANVTITYDDGGSALVSVGGVLGADRNTSAEFTSTLQNGKLALVAKDSGLPASLKSGELNALAEVYSKKIPEYQAKIDNIVNSIMTNVNSLHTQGTDISNPPQQGLNFFESYDNGLLSVNYRILSDPSKIAISADGTAGNGDIANQIADLQNSKLVDNATFEDSYGALISQIANDKTSQENTQQATDMAIQQMQAARASTSGVSIDEEMTNMIKYQRSYDASAKLISTADQLLQTLLNMVQ